MSRITHHRPVRGGDPSFLPILQSTILRSKTQDPDPNDHPSLHDLIITLSKTPTTQKALPIKPADHPYPLQDETSATYPEKVKKHTDNPTKDGDIVDGPLVDLPLLPPCVDILNDMKAE